MKFHFRRHFRLRPKMKNAFRSASSIYIIKRSWSWSWTRGLGLGLGLERILKSWSWSWSWSKLRSWSWYWKKVLITSLSLCRYGQRLRLGTTADSIIGWTCFSRSLEAWMNSLRSTIQFHGTSRQRQSQQFQCLQPSVDAYKYAFFPRTISVWNALLVELVRRSRPSHWRRSSCVCSHSSKIKDNNIDLTW